MTNRTRRKRPAAATASARFTRREFESNNGMLTTVWGAPMWAFLHNVSFNYPVRPSALDKSRYRRFILSLRYILPCGKCRKNFRKNLRALPLTDAAMESRDTFSKYIYDLHEVVNKMLHKPPGPTYESVRNQYENFRARCLAAKKAEENGTAATPVKDGVKKEDGCTEPLYEGAKSRCVMRIVPVSNKCPTMQIDQKCVKRRVTKRRKRGGA